MRKGAGYDNRRYRITHPKVPKRPVVFRSPKMPGLRQRFIEMKVRRPDLAGAIDDLLRVCDAVKTETRGMPIDKAFRVISAEFALNGRLDRAMVSVNMAIKKLKGVNPDKSSDLYFITRKHIGELL